MPSDLIFFKTDIHLEIPNDLSCDVLLLTFDHKRMKMSDVIDMKRKLGEKISEILLDYPASMKFYKVNVH